ncbi:Epoxyqueuosine (oQ) reductase QueG [Geitlerinema sp. FC II]|nr:Epoxyqueuosine (oQ) reductase QueG [Geitlerinema sp. FC II]
MVSIPQRDFGEFQPAVGDRWLLEFWFQSLKGILVNFNSKARSTALGMRFWTAFQSLKGILVNFNFLRCTLRLHPATFQSLKGILVNFNFEPRLICPF